MGFLFGSAKAATLPATRQPAATLPAETPAVPVKETDAEVRKKKQRTSRLARTRLGHGATVKTGACRSLPIRSARRCWATVWGIKHT